MKLLHEAPFEYGWKHSGVESWGKHWHRRAVAVAYEQIRAKIASMVNLKELERFTKKDLSGKLGVTSTSTQDSSSLGVEFGGNKSDEERLRLVKENFFLVDVRNVRIKPGTDWSKTRDHWLRGRSWKASAVMLCDLLIYGKE